MSRKTLSTRIKEFEEIERKHAGLTRKAKKCRIYKVHEQLRDESVKAYEPVLLAIGPYNDQGKVGQGFMEEHKLRYLQQMLERTPERSVETYITTLRKLEETARKCYVECISQKPDEFLEMMVLDGCFIIELFRKHEICRETRRCPDDPIFQMKWVLPRIARDLLLFENQLPLFVLAELFEMSSESANNNTPLHDLARNFFHCFLPFKCVVDEASRSQPRSEIWFSFKDAEFEHLLGLVHASISISVLDMDINRVKNAIIKPAMATPHGSESQAQRNLQEKPKSSETPRRVEILIKDPSDGNENEDGKLKECETGTQKDGVEKRKSISDYVKWLREAGVESKKLQKRNTHSATELEEAGIGFKAAEDTKVVSIKFHNKQMEISPLTIVDETETFLRNLIAYEQYCDQVNNLDYITNYVCFMDDLINSPKDVKILRRSGIIRNYLGDDEATSSMLNKLGHNIVISYGNSIYARTSMDLNKHCSITCNKWIANLRHDYFNSPWAFVSFLAAVLLLSLAIVQTVFSVIP